jgi:erythromycin esterase
MPLSLMSPAFPANGEIPVQYTCDGDDVAPPLGWSGEPPGTESFALIVDDPDAPDPAAPKRVYVHWVLYDIPAEARGLPEGATRDDLPPGTHEGKNDWGRTGYGGPCPPIGRHRYFFKLYALDTILQGLREPTKAQVQAAMAGHVLESAELIGTYERRGGARHGRAHRHVRCEPTDATSASGGTVMRRDESSFRADQEERRAAELEESIGGAAQRLRSVGDLDELLERIGDARYVLLGEATHGTSEFYGWRDELSRRLIEERGFSFIAVEGDWPDCYRVDRFVKARRDSGESAEAVLHAFDRWPTWMWANREVVRLVEWLRGHNERAAADRQVGFYGLDVYSLWDSMAAVVEYLERVDPALAAGARRAYTCFDPYHDDAQEYARATALVPTSCEDEAVAVLRALRERAVAYREDGRDGYFNAEQNALVARNAELYYRTMVRGGPTSWNVRDNHMVETLERLMAHHGPAAKAIVWEHNTHIGDARFTNMAGAGMVNVGQLVRERHGREGVVLVGFGTHHGTVIAAAEWGLPMRRLRVPDARAGSVEDLLHRAVGHDALFLFDGSDDGGVSGLDGPVNHRAIGVVYDPRRERWGNYVPTLLPRRYDAFLYVDETRALDPLHMPVRADAEVAETYPSGM